MSPALPVLRLGLTTVWLLTCLSGCKPCPSPGSAAPQTDPALQPPAEDEFSVMTYNVRRFRLDDRDRDGQQDDPKPKEECDALFRIISSAAPDVLAVQEMGDSTFFQEFGQSLQRAGLDYPFHDYLYQPESDVHLGLFSRYPILSSQPHTNDWYSIGETRLPVMRGFIDVEIGVNPAYTFRLLVAHLKSKVFHELGQTEMRRNEARLLANHVREAIAANPRLNLMVTGDFNDTPGSRPLREVLGMEPRNLIDLRPADVVGDVWTHRFAPEDSYSRIDYILVSRGMLPEVVREKTCAIRDPEWNVASDHRPLMAVFKNRDLAAAP